MVKYLAALILLFLSALLVFWHAGSILSAPAQTAVGPAPVDLNARVVVINGVHGWFVPAEDSRLCVLLLHGIGADRRIMVERARFLQKAGYASLLIDLQAHGETLGEYITFGYLESESAHSAVTYLRRQQQCQKVASIGQSLGGAASLLGQAPIDVDVYVLEAVYSTIEEAVENRLALRTGFRSHLIAPLLYYQIPLRLHISLSALRPADAIKNINSPVLIINGSADQHTTINNSRRLYDNAPAAREYWLIDHAGHTDFHRLVPQQYEQVVLQFLARYMVNDIDLK